MGCKCKEKNQKDTSNAHLNLSNKNNIRQTSPIEGCLFCAEKHLSTAAALARETKYESINRGYVIGEIVAACWHLNGLNDPKASAIADELREFRHKIQSRNNDKECLDFSKYLTELDDLIKENT